MIIDFHTHIVPPQVKENRSRYIKEDPCFALFYSDPRMKLATAEDLIASMDRAGIDRSVVLNIAWTSPELCRRTNDYIAEVISRYPERLIGLCSIQPRAGAAAELERCHRAGIRGIGEIRSDIQGFDLGDKALMQPIAEVAQRYGLIILIHASEPVGHPYPGKGTITPEVLYRFILNFPALHVVLAHWGGGLPFYALMPEVAQALANVYFDTAASSLLYRDQVFQLVAQLVGGEKILFGSDYPLLPQERALAAIKSLNLPPPLEANILGENGQRLLAR